MGQGLLFIHLIGAAYLVFLLTCSAVVLYKKGEKHHKFLSVQVALTTALQLFSGSILAITSTNSVSPASFCSKIGLYFAAVLIVEVLLFKRMQFNTPDNFPTKQVTSTLAIGLIFVFATILNL